MAPTALAALRSVPDNANNRALIVVNDFSAIWRSAGLSVPPTLHQVGSKTGMEATVQVVSGSPAGSLLWQDVATYPTPLGYPVLDLGGEVEVGQVPKDLGEVWGPMSQSQVLKALTKLKPRAKKVGPDLVLDLGSKLNLLRPAPFDQILLSTRFIAVPKKGNRLVTGGVRAPSSAVTGLSDGTTRAGALSGDPLVSRVLGAFGSTFESMAMGTSFIATPDQLFKNDTPRERALLEKAIGLSHLPASPLMVGVAYTDGAPKAESVVAAALYPTPADAEAAAKTVARYAGTGDSLQSRQPYRQLWRVNRTRVQGNLVVMDLTTKYPGSVSRALTYYDFPLFWAPNN